MAKVQFIKDFYWHWPEYKGRVTTAYKAGTTETIKRACADEAIAKGAAKEVKGTGGKASTNKAAADGESTD